MNSLATCHQLTTKKPITEYIFLPTAEKMGGLPGLFGGKVKHLHLVTKKCTVVQLFAYSIASHEYGYSVLHLCED